MPFKVTGTNQAGAETTSFTNAGAALKAMLKMENDGFAEIVVKDNLGRTLSRDDLVMLAYPNG